MSTSSAIYLLVLLGILVLPAVASFARPDKLRWVLATGAILAIGFWITSWFGDSGEWGRGGTMLVVAFFSAVLFAVWTGSASIGWVVRRRRHVASVYRRLQAGSQKRRRRLI